MTLSSTSTEKPKDAHHSAVQGRRLHKLFPRTSEKGPENRGVRLKRLPKGALRHRVPSSHDVRPSRYLNRGGGWPGGWPTQAFLCLTGQFHDWHDNLPRRSRFAPSIPTRFQLVPHRQLRSREDCSTASPPGVRTTRPLPDCDEYSAAFPQTAGNLEY